MRINTNVGALTAARNLNNVEQAVQKSSEKLSSGFRINRAADDAAGLGIANVLRSDIRAYTQAQRNAEQANSVYSIAEGASQNIQKMLERMKELATQSASDTVDSAARVRVNTEFADLISEITRTVSTTKFQGQTLLNGGFGATVDTASTALATATAGIYSVALSGASAGSYTLSAAGGSATMTNGTTSQVLTGVTAATNQTLNFSQFGISLNTNTSVTQGSFNAMNVTVGAGSGGVFLVGASGAYGTNDTLSVSALDLTVGTLTVSGKAVDTRANAVTALAALDVAIGKVNTALGAIGSGQNRIESAIDNLKSTIQNYSAAESTVRDLDMAEEMVKFSKNQILAQAGTAMLAQANQAGQGVLKLLQ